MRAEAIGDTADGPSGQIVVCLGGQVMAGLMLSQMSSSLLTSEGRPWPSSMRRRIFSSQAVPSRHGVHLPHDSRAKKRTTRQAALTASVVSSLTNMEPHPRLAPARPHAPVSL